ncbi:hypothetical protein Tco_1409194 [Tanacetum coccineum]
MNQNFYNSNSSCFDQFQPSQYPVVHQLLEEKSIEELKTMMQSYCEIMSQRREQEAILLQDDEKQEFTPSTTYTIHLTKSATIITNPSELTRCIYHNHDIFYNGDDDEELLPDEIKRIQQILESTSFDAITPDFLITDSLSMGDEHLSTISKTESDELIKFSVENLVATPSESEDLSNIESECDVPVCDDFTTVSNPLFDADNDFSSSDDKSFSDKDRLLYDNSSPRPREEFNSENYDAIIEPFSPSPIPVEDSDSLMKEIDLFLTSDDFMPPGIKNDDYDSEGDILFFEEFLSNDSPSLHENVSFHFDVPSSPRPPAKPPDDGIYFELDTGVFTKVVDDISDNSTRELYVHVPNVLTIPPTLSLHLSSH